MAIPAWFDEYAYLSSKLNQLTASGETKYTTVNQVKTAILAAGFTSTYQHFAAYSLAERTNPNDYFNTNEYLAAKAVQLGGTWTAEKVALAIQNAGYSNAYEHFLQWGWKEGVNPSNAFDVSNYLESKAAQSGLTVEQVTAAMTAAGLDPISHYLLYGKNETGVTVTAVPTAEQVAADTSGAAGKTFTLTTDTESKTGGAGSDIFNGSDKTVVLDVLDGAAGNDTLNYNDTTGGSNLNAHGLTLTSVETINIRSVGAATATTTGFSDVENVNVLVGTSAAVTAAATTDVSVADVSGAVVIDGGKNITVTNNASGNDITIGATTAVAGNVTVTSTKAGASSIAVDGGVNVTLNVAGTSGGGDTITVGNGGAATDHPTGVVSVTSAHTGVAATDVTLDAITVKGGSTVTVTQTSDTSKAAADTVGATLTQGAVTVVGGGSTTSVAVAQAHSTTEVVGVTGVAGVTETASVKFSALNAGQTLVMGGLTFTASTAMTANEAAAVFASLVNGTIPVPGDTQGSGAAAKGTYTGAFTGWTSGTANGDTVVFTSTTANSNVADLANVGTGTVTVTTAAGSAKTTAVTGVLGVIDGVVTIDDAAAASITTVSVDGYGNASTIGNTATLSKLATLSLANSGGVAAGATNGSMLVDAAGVASLNLTLNAIKGAVSLDGAADGALKTLNVTTTGADSNFALIANAVETLTVAGAQKATFSADLAALKALTVTGAASLALSGSEADTLTSVSSAGTTGSVSATIDGAKATYTGGAGVDTVTLATSTALTKAIDLGAGDDTLSFAALAVTGSTATLSGGAGTDTLTMKIAAADGLDGTAQTFYTNFEHLTLTDLYTGGTADTQETLTLDLAKLGFTNYVTTSGTLIDASNRAGESDILVLDKLASNGTVVLTADGLVSVNVADAATGTADVLNLVLSSSGNLAAGNLVAANVETINISTVDTESAPQTKNVDTLTLTADKATTLNLTGAQDLTLTLTGSTKVAAIDAHAMTGGLTVTSLNTTSATTITGGSGNDVLTAATGTTADVLLGGAGDDTLTANAGLTTMTGGVGNDLFVINTASLNSSSYATITDFGAGDLLQMAGITGFTSAKVTLGDTAVFQDYANAAINSLAATKAGWFQYGGNTYVVADMGADGTTFTNSQDFIVKLTGTVDLTNASFNSTHATIAL